LPVPNRLPINADVAKTFTSPFPLNARSVIADVAKSSVGSRFDRIGDYREFNSFLFLNGEVHLLPTAGRKQEITDSTSYLPIYLREILGKSPESLTSSAAFTGRAAPGKSPQE
jgi:hypothetical protein